MGRRWWMRRQDDEDAVSVLGDEGEGLVLVTTMRDSEGEPVEKRWMTVEQASEWDEKRWSQSWGLS